MSAKIMYRIYNLQTFYHVKEIRMKDDLATPCKNRLFIKKIPQKEIAP